MKKELPFGLKAHEYAEFLPITEGRARDLIFEDIKANGIKKPVVLIRGKVLDGRNRLLMAHEIGLKKEDIPFREFNPTLDGDPLEFVKRENVLHRHLSEGQLSLIAANIAKEIAKQIKENKANVSEEAKVPTGNTGAKDAEGNSGTGNGESSGDSAEDKKSVPSHEARKKAAKKMGVSEDSVKKASLIGKYPELKTKLEAGQISLDAAYQEACRLRDAQKEKDNAKKIKAERAEIIAAIAKQLGEDSQIVSAIKKGSILKDHKELKAFNELDKNLKNKIAVLIIQKISVRNAVKIASDTPAGGHTVDELVNWFLVQIAANKPAELKHGGGVISFKPAAK